MRRTFGWRLGRNAWFGNKAGHRKAARKGHRRKGHKVCNNPGLALTKPMAMVKAGFDVSALKRAGIILGGVWGTNKLAEMALAQMGGAGSSVLAQVGVRLVAAGGLAMLAKRFMPAAVSADDVLLGGILNGVTAGLAAQWPGKFSRLGEDLEGIGDGIGDFAIPNQRSFSVGDYGGPQDPVIGMNDYAALNQGQSAFQLRGQDDVVAEFAAQA